MKTRYLVVFAKNRWEVIDVHNNCEVVDYGSYAEMLESAKMLEFDRNSETNPISEGYPIKCRYCGYNSEDDSGVCSECYAKREGNNNN